MLSLQPCARELAIFPGKARRHGRKELEARLAQGEYLVTPLRLCPFPIACICGRINCFSIVDTWIRLPFPLILTTIKSVRIEGEIDDYY